MQMFSLAVRSGRRAGRLARHYIGHRIFRLRIPGRRLPSGPRTYAVRARPHRAFTGRRGRERRPRGRPDQRALPGRGGPRRRLWRVSPRLPSAKPAQPLPGLARGAAAGGRRRPAPRRRRHPAAPRPARRSAAAAPGTLPTARVELLRVLGALSPAGERPGGATARRGPRGRLPRCSPAVHRGSPARCGAVPRMLGQVFCATGPMRYDLRLARLIPTTPGDQPHDTCHTPYVPRLGRRRRSRARAGRAAGVRRARPRGGHGDDHRRAARGDPHAGEPQLRPLLRDAAGACAGSPTAARSRSPAATACSTSPTARAGSTRGSSAPPSRPAARTPSGWPSATATSRTAGRTSTWRGTAASWTRGWPPRATSARWATCTRDDIPFHYALADNWTVCDAYFSSILSATGPNRTYHWSGMIDPDGTAGGPAYNGGDESGLRWQTYAEALEAAGRQLEALPERGGQLRRQRAGVLQPVRERPGRQRAGGQGHGHGAAGHRPHPGRHRGRDPRRRRPRARCRRCRGSSPTRAPPSTRTPRPRTARTSSTWSSTR